MMGEPLADNEPAPCALYVYIENCDQVFDKALEAGGVTVMEVTTMHHAGER